MPPRDRPLLAPGRARRLVVLRVLCGDGWMATAAMHALREPGGDPVTDPILRTAHWTVTVADPPMPGALHHWVLTPTVRAADILALPVEAYANLWTVMHNLTRGLPGYAWATRAGDPQATGGPVGVVDVVVGNPDAAETARYVMSGRMAP